MACSVEQAAGLLALEGMFVADVLPAEDDVDPTQEDAPDHDPNATLEPRGRRSDDDLDMNQEVDSQEGDTPDGSNEESEEEDRNEINQHAQGAYNAVPATTLAQMASGTLGLATAVVRAVALPVVARLLVSFTGVGSSTAATAAGVNNLSLNETHEMQERQATATSTGIPLDARDAQATPSLRQRPEASSVQAGGFGSTVEAEDSEFSPRWHRQQRRRLQHETHEHAERVDTEMDESQDRAEEPEDRRRTVCVLM